MRLLKNKFIVKFRNYLNLKPVKIFSDIVPSKASVSDFFPWRLDCGFLKLIFVLLITLRSTTQMQEASLKFTYLIIMAN